MFNTQDEPYTNSSRTLSLLNIDNCALNIEHYY